MEPFDLTRCLDALEQNRQIFVSLQSLKQQYRAEPSPTLEDQIRELKRQADDNYDIVIAELEAIRAAADAEREAIAQVIGDTE